MNGFLIAPKDTKALAERLEVLINDADLRRCMGLAGRQKAEREFDIRHVVEEHLKLYAKGESEEGLFIHSPQLVDSLEGRLVGPTPAPTLKKRGAS